MIFYFIEGDIHNAQTNRPNRHQQNGKYIYEKNVCDITILVILIRQIHPQDIPLQKRQKGDDFVEVKSCPFLSKFIYKVHNYSLFFIF